MDREKLKVLKEKSRERLLVGKGGGLRILPERPEVVIFKEDKVAFRSKTVNYAVLQRAIYSALMKGEFSDKEGNASVKVFVNDNGDVVISFKTEERQGAIGFTPFKFRVLLNILEHTVNTVPVFQEIIETDKGKLKLSRNRSRVFFSYGNVPIELPLPERIMLRVSLSQFIYNGEVRPFIGALSKAENTQEGSYVVLGIDDYRIPVNSENLPKLMAVL